MDFTRLKESEDVPASARGTARRRARPDRSRRAGRRAAEKPARRHGRRRLRARRRFEQRSRTAFRAVQRSGPGVGRVPPHVRQGADGALPAVHDVDRRIQRGRSAPRAEHRLRRGRGRRSRRHRRPRDIARLEQPAPAQRGRQHVQVRPRKRRGRRRADGVDLGVHTRRRRHPCATSTPRARRWPTTDASEASTSSARCGTSSTSHHTVVATGTRH